MIIKKRQPNGDYRLFKDGVHVGSVFKCSNRKFGLSLGGVYWRNGKPNSRGGLLPCGSTGCEMP